MAESLKTTTLRNVGYNSVAKVIQLVVMAVSNVILTRTLAPSDYGIVGFAYIFTAFLTQFSDLGIGSAVIQKKELEQRELYTAFTIKFALGLGMFFLAFLGAPLAVHFFDNPAIVGVIRVLAFNFVLNTTWFLPTLLLTRDLDFRKLATANLIPVLLNAVVAITLAMLGFKYWSLVVGAVVLSIGTGMLMNLFYPVRYRFAYDAEVARRLIRFGGNIFMAGFITFLIFNADNFLIGTVKGATGLGYYSLAFNWGSMASTIIGGVILNVLQPTFARMQDDRERLKSSYLKVLQIVSFGGILVNTTLFVVSHDFLYLVLGHHSDKWLPALTALRILCLYGILRLLLEPVGQVVIALARTDVLRKATLLVAVIELLGLYPALYFLGIEGVAALVTVAYAAQYGLYLRIIGDELRISLRDLWSAIGPAVVGMLALLPLYLFGETGNNTSVIFFIVKLFLYVSLYLITYGVVTKWKSYGDMWSLAKGIY